MNEIQGAAVEDSKKSGHKKTKQQLKSNVESLQDFLESGLKCANPDLFH